MDGLDADDFDRNYSDVHLVRRIISYFMPYKRNIIIIIISLLIGSLASTLVPIYISLMIDNLQNSLLTIGINPYAPVVLNLAMFLALFFIINFIGNLFQYEYTAKTTANSVVDIRKDVFKAVLERDMSFITEESTGNIVSRVDNDTNNLSQSITLATSLIAQLSVVIFLLIFLLMKSLRLTILLLLMVPVVVITALLFRRIAREVNRKSARVLAKINAMIQETFSGIYITKAFRAENETYDEFLDVNTTSYKVNLKRGLVMSSIFPVLDLIIGIFTGLLIYFGGIDFLNNSSAPLFSLISWIPSRPITIGDWFLFFQGVLVIFFPLTSVASFWSQFQQSLAAAERVFALIDAENTVVQYDSQLLQNPQGMIEFRNLTFAYKPGANILENFDLHINGHEKIAIVGHTGAGKSTLVKLISRSYEFQSGELLIDNQDIRSLDLTEYRKRIAIISQEVFLWNDTIKNNLLYGSNHIPNAEQRMNKILESLEIMDWIERLPEGLETVVGERGSRLSMGQRQLIAFARILLVDPLILIMDEATSSVDPLTEVMIQRAINLLLKERTSIVVAHRLSTVKNADRIIVMKEGKIIEEGNHQTLLDKNGYYAELYDTYFRHQSLAYIEQQVNSTD